jgi:hypothetical protein
MRLWRRGLAEMLSMLDEEHRSDICESLREIDELSLSEPDSPTASRM